MRDLSSQCTYMSVTLRNVNLHSCHVMCTDTGEYRMPCLAQPTDEGQGRTVLLDNGGQVGQRGWSSATYAFAESSTERSRRFAALRKRKQRSQGTVEAKRARRKQEKVQKREHAVESLHKPGVSLFMVDSTVVVLNAHICTGAARCEASCTCVVLVICK